MLELQRVVLSSGRATGMRREILPSVDLKDSSIKYGVPIVGSGYHNLGIDVKEVVVKGSSDSEGSEFYHYHDAGWSATRHLGKSF